MPSKGKSVLRTYIRKKPKKCDTIYLCSLVWMDSSTTLKYNFTGKIEPCTRSTMTIGSQAPMHVRARPNAHCCRKTSWLSSSRFQEIVCTCDCRTFFITGRLLRVGDTLLEVVRMARTVAAHGKVAMILPVGSPDYVE